MHRSFEAYYSEFGTLPYRIIKPAIVNACSGATIRADLQPYKESNEGPRRPSQYTGWGVEMRSVPIGQVNARLDRLTLVQEPVGGAAGGKQTRSREREREREDRVAGGKVLFVRQHPYVPVIGSLAFDLPSEGHVGEEEKGIG